jgi:septal ring factor EnvC (AmiA/AmiB activator)
MGTVTMAGWNGSYGNMVVLDHGFGIVTKFGHLSRFGVMMGQQVNRGDIIGFVGSTAVRPARTCTTRSGSTAAREPDAPLLELEIDGSRLANLTPRKS